MSSGMQKPWWTRRLYSYLLRAILRSQWHYSSQIKDEAAAAQFSEDFQTFYAFAPFSNSHTHEHHIQKITYMGRVEKREKTTSTPERSLIGYTFFAAAMRNR